MSSSMVFESADVVAVVRGPGARGPAAAVVVRLPEARGRVLRPRRVRAVRAAYTIVRPFNCVGIGEGAGPRRGRGAQRQREARHEPRRARPRAEGAEGPGPAAHPRRRQPGPALHLRRRPRPRASSPRWSTRTRSTTTSTSRPRQSTTVLELAELIWQQDQGRRRAVPLRVRRPVRARRAAARARRPRRPSRSSASRPPRRSTRCSTRSSPGSSRRWPRAGSDRRPRPTAFRAGAFSAGGGVARAVVRDGRRTRARRSSVEYDSAAAAAFFAHRPARRRVAQQVRHRRGHELGVGAGEHDARSPVVDHRRNRAERKRDHRAARHQRFDDDARNTFRIAGEQEQVDAAEHVLHVVTVTEHVHHGRQIDRARAARRSRRGTGRRRRPRGEQAGLARERVRGHRAPRSGRFCWIRCPTSPSSGTAGARPSSSRNRACGAVPIDADEPVGTAEVADRPDRAAEAAARGARLPSPE